MPKGEDLLPPNGGFSFDQCRRNEMLVGKGLKQPSFLKTGTTIVGLIFKDGVILGADTRATEGPIVADNIRIVKRFIAWLPRGAGTTADTEAATDCTRISQRDEGLKLVAEAICSGIFNDLGSGSNVDICVITKGKQEYLRNYMLPNPRTNFSEKGYSFSRKTEVLLTKITPLREMVEVIEGGEEWKNEEH